MDYAIIAAGEGSRLAQEGIQWPKPLVPLNGVPLIDRLIGIFLRNGASSIHIIVNEEMKEVQEYIRKMNLPVPLHLLIKSTPSSMHSFYELSRSIKSDKVCLTTVDTIFKEENFTPYIRAFLTEDHWEGIMAVTDYIDDEKPLFVQTDETGRITAFSDEMTPDIRYISGGIYCLKKPAIELLQRAMDENISRMRNYQRRLVSEGLSLKAWPLGKIIDVDHAEDISKAEQFLHT